MSEPKRCEYCGEVHGPDNPVRREDYERHHLLKTDFTTMPALDPIESLSDEAVAVQLAREARDDFETVLNHPEWGLPKQTEAEVEKERAELTEEVREAEAALIAAEGPTALDHLADVLEQQDLFDQGLWQPDES